MAEAKKEGIFAKLFGAKKSCCCNVRIEEVPADEPKASAAKGMQQAPSARPGQPAKPAAGGGSPDRKQG